MVTSDVDTASRIVRLETKLDFIIERIDRLPPSPACIAKHKEIDDRMDSMEMWRNRILGALFLANIILVIAMDKIRAFFFSQ